MNKKKQWDSKLYDQSQDFVSAYGKALINELPTEKGLNILDLGCGTGDLSHEIMLLRHQVLGIDASPSMIQLAQEKYPSIEFRVKDATQLNFQNFFDVVFSNATFHWIAEQDVLLSVIRQSLKPNGYLICEFGAQGNIEQLCRAFDQALQKRGARYITPFFFPSDQEYTQLLNKAGFEIETLYSFSRPTILPHGAAGLGYWMQQFFSTRLQEYSEQEQAEIIQDCEQQLQPTLFNGKEWVADYRRLRIKAKIANL